MYYTHTTLLMINKEKLRQYEKQRMYERNIVRSVPERSIEPEAYNIPATIFDKPG